VDRWTSHPRRCRPKPTIDGSSADLPLIGSVRAYLVIGHVAAMASNRRRQPARRRRSWRVFPMRGGTCQAIEAALDPAFVEVSAIVDLRFGVRLSALGAGAWHPNVSGWDPLRTKRIRIQRWVGGVRPRADRAVAVLHLRRPLSPDPHRTHPRPESAATVRVPWPLPSPSSVNATCSPLDQPASRAPARRRDSGFSVSAGPVSAR
jgi:hypothetical protein